MYKYETHCHTSEGSKCAKESAVSVVDFYKSRGYDGLFITDHFLNGNTTVDTHQSWEAQVEDYCKPYELAKKRGEEIGLDVFFGWEYTYKYIGRGGKRCMGTDFLTYGLDKNWLLRHPEVMDFELMEYCDFIHSEGGFIIHAHPFREDSYIDMMRLVPRHVDGVEVLNSSRPEFENKMADVFAEHYGLLKTSGSDTHYFNREKFSGIYMQKRLEAPIDMFPELKDGTAQIFVENK